jgi:hypothetical protein
MSLLDSLTRDRLVINGPIQCDETWLKSGENLKRGAVLGKCKFTIPTTGTLAGTGNGTMTIVKGGPKTKRGTYTATAASLTATAVSFNVTNPDGKYLGQCTVGLGTADTAMFSSEEISFLITNSSTDFDGTSVFTVAVAALIPATATVTGTGNGTLPQLETRRLAKVGSYLARCSVAPLSGTHGGAFALTDPDSNAIGTVYAGYRHNGSGAATGTGALTEIKAGPLFKANGSYKIKCTVAASHGGTFSVTDPDGTVIGTFSLPGTSTGVATFWHEQISFKLADATDFIVDDEIVLFWYENDHLGLVIWDGATDFIVGDYFTLAVAIADRQCVIVNRDNVDGSDVPFAVLAEDCDASTAAVKTVCYTSGVFNERALYFGGDDDIEDHRAALRAIGIETRASQPIGAE